MKIQKFYSWVLLSLCASLFTFSSAFSQDETHTFVTYDTVINLGSDHWNVRISRPKNMFVPGDPDAAARPAIIMMPGQGEQGTADQGTLTVYGPHYWLNNGWDGSVVLGNGKHYPVLITISYINNVYPMAPAYYNALSYILNTYHIKRNSVHVTGLSQGAFTNGSLIQYEATAGDETGMKLVTSAALFEGTPQPLPAPYSTWDRGLVAYQVWASKYHGRYFYLEGSGSDNFRDGWHYSDAMNSVVPGSAYFSYETLGGGAHCCWNSMYDPNANNWTSVGTLGPNNGGSQAGQNSMGNYHAPSSVFQWMLRQGDTSVVNGSAPAPVPPTVNAGSAQTITLPATATLTGTASGNAGAVITATSWTELSGPNSATIVTASALSTQVTGLAAGTYVFQLKANDNKSLSSVSTVTITVKAATAPPPLVSIGTTPVISLPTSSATLTGTASANGGSAISSTVWSEVSGPNTATIVTPSALSTSVTGLVAGTYTFRLTATNTSGMSTASTVTLTVNPPAGTGIPIPGIVQAENYSVMSGVQTEGTADVNGGMDVGWIDPADWMNYSVSVSTAGSYTASFRIAALYYGASLQLKNAAGAVLATVNLPVTGAWQNWQTVTATVTLPAGNQVLQIVSTATPFNINWIDFELAGSSAPPPPPTGNPIPGIIQAESYSTMSGVQTETTADVSGGMDVGWIDPADWMNYNVSVATAGSYTASFRIATLYYGASLQLKNAAGAVLATVNLPVTGAWQNWQTVTATVTLPAGNQVLQIVSTATPFNINWMDFENKTGASVQSTMATTSAATLGTGSDPLATSSVSVYPDPVPSSLRLAMTNAHTGKMIVQVMDPSGKMKKNFNLYKAERASNTELFIGDLTPGIYFLRIQIGEWTEIKKILKL